MSSSSRGGFKKALASAFGMASKSDARQTLAARPESAALSATSNQTASRRPLQSQRAEALDHATKRLAALEFARQTGRRAVAYVRRKLNSRTPPEQLPKTWKEFELLYANVMYASQGDVDIEDPPLPPQRVAEDGAEPTPFQNRFWPAPLPPNEAIRQDIVERLDLFGSRAKAAMNASQATLNIASGPAGSASAPMEPTMSNASAASYLTTPSDVASSRRNSSSAHSTRSASTSATTAASPSLDQEAIESLQDSPVFKSIIAKAREIFNVPMALITVLDGEQQLFLASGGLSEGMPNAMPRSASFCGHTILGDRGLVVLNSTEDWRFAQNMITTHLGGRFYAGIPVTASDPDDPDLANVPVGSLCIVDRSVRDEFTEAHRRVLRDLAKQASNAIEVWSAERRMRRGQASLSSAPSAAQRSRSTLCLPPNLSPDAAGELLTPPPSASLPFPPASVQSALRRPKTAGHPPAASLPATPPASIHRATPSHGRSNSDAASTVSSIPASEVVAPRRPSALSLGVTTEDPVSMLPREVQKMFDTAVRMLAKSLELELVYIASLDLATLANEGTLATTGSKLRILASHGLPHPPPSFDPALHLKALRAPEGGLIYKNPRFVPSATSSYAAGILIPVLEVRRLGYVLCGYTRNSERAFVQRDLALLVKMAESLETTCVKASKSLATAQIA
ncbi:hypothetical protein Rhopal_005053-T1 [Rhodotorula paludigena]|uniref:GAF domain-containing protein n=1 Tax=Rhodotorula paludigena TaxID=86838 RepID=A0AAV5GRA9_9BASI|nr:hypothetical protein Rhopal_005053-T1 [Rhodotorula paludigena]